MYSMLLILGIKKSLDGFYNCNMGLFDVLTICYVDEHGYFFG